MSMVPLFVRRAESKNKRNPRAFICNRESDELTWTVEGVESERHRFVLGVRWHPERMRDDRRRQALFCALVAAARR